MNRTINPRMLELARESRGLTQGQLADILRVTQGKISKSESGISAVSDEQLKETAKALHYPETFFCQFEPVPPAGSACLYHRKRQSMPATDLRKMQAKVNIVRMQMQKLLQGAEIDSVNKIHRMDVDDYPGGPQEVAAKLRENWGLQHGPIANMVNVLEDAGGVVFRWPFGTRKLDAISQWVPGLAPLIFVNAEAPTDRVRFSLAHELGHLIMHHVPTPNQEREADQFASEFLMPAKEIKPYLQPLSLQKAAALKPHWRVAIAAIIKRAYDLGVIKESYYRKLFTQLSKLGYRTCEPAPLAEEEPTILRDIIDVHLRSHKYSVRELSAMVCLDEDEFRSQYLPEQITLRLA